MRTLLFAAGVSVLILSVSICGPAMAYRNAGGAMLLHTNDAISYSAGADYCTLNPLPPTCDQLVTQINKDPNLEAMIWMAAVFPPTSSPAVTAFQVGLGGDVTIDYMTDWSPCGPGFLEIPDATWPGAGAGTAVAYSGPVNSTIFKMYWFACGAPGVGSSLSTTDYYGGDHHAEWADDSTPPNIDFCVWFGAVQWGGPGHNDCACCDAPVGACCFPDGHCEVLDHAACDGVYQGDGTTCPPNPPCPPPVGACCICIVCTIQTQADCIQHGGTYKGDGTTCDPPVCLPPPGACCYPDGSCNWIPECECATGDWRQGMPCDPNPCPPTPTRSTTWGRIKQEYR